MDNRQARDLDNWITGHYGEDQFRDDCPDNPVNETTQEDETMTAISHVCQTAGWLPLETTGPKFPMGRFVATPGAFALGIDLQALLARHASGDWGDLCAEDLATNEHDLAHGERLFSSYKTEKGTVWIITERDRSVTTILLPSEY
jgi:hypothetical protein